MKTLLSIAGFDPTSGAGITKDVEVFFSLGFHGIGIPTSFVIQGPRGVSSLHPVPIEIFENMLEELKEIEIEGVKTGVFVNDEYMEIFSTFISEKAKKKPVVVDPVMKSKNGYSLLDERGVLKLKERVIPLSTAITPNKDEAEALTGLKIERAEDVRECAKRLKELGAKNVIIKGGHMEGELFDLFYDGSSFIEKKKQRLERTVHGTGCIFSSVLLSFLAMGLDPREAFLEAENTMDFLMREAYSIHEPGYMYSSLSLSMGELARRFEVLSKMKELKDKIEILNPVDLIPEVQMNVCYAIQGAKGIEDVCAYPGRIWKYGGKVFVKSDPEFGASSHMARAILTFMKFYPHIRSCANLKYKKEFVENGKKNGLKIAYVDRRFEPPEVKEKEGRSLDFLIEKVLKENPFIPDLIYDEGDFGKEPMIRVFAKDPFELLNKMEKLLR